MYITDDINGMGLFRRGDEHNRYNRRNHLLLSMQVGYGKYFFMF